MDPGIDYSRIGEMFICTVHGEVHFSLIAEMQKALCMDSAKCICIIHGQCIMIDN